METRDVIIWFSLLLIILIVCLIGLENPKTTTIDVGPHETYRWIADSSNTLLGDGKTHVYLKSTDGNFTIYNSDDLYVTSGQPQELQPGDSKQTFLADFQLAEGESYTLSDNSVDIYTVESASLSFESTRWFFLWILIIVLVILFISLFILID